MAEQPTFVYLLMSTLWLAVFFGGLALLVKLWLPGRREHKERMKAMELEAKRLAEAEHAKKLRLPGTPQRFDPFARMDETFARMDDLFKSTRFPMWSSTTVATTTPVEGEEPDPKAVEAAQKVTEAMTNLNEAMVQVQEAMKATIPTEPQATTPEQPK